MDGAMLTNYAEKMDGWKEWQVQWRYGAILIYPPEPHLSKVTKLRDRYQWSQGCICDAHISMTVPLPVPLLEHHVEEVSTAISKVEPFTIKYGPIIEKPVRPGVLLKIEPQDRLRDLVSIVESTSAYENHISRSYPFWAHMTIAENPTMEQSYEIINELRDLNLVGEFRLEYLSYAVPDENFAFTDRLRIKLGQ